MASITARGVAVDFPIYAGGRRSLRKLLLATASRGNIAKDARQRPTVHALTNINLNLEDGDRLAVLGANGAGKSTLLKVLGGIYRPTQGEVLSSGRIAGLLTPSIGLNGDATGRENILVLGMYMNIPPRDMTRRIGEIIAFAELENYVDMPVRTYSAGMIVRLCFAVATSIEPDILLLDEWIGNADEAFLVKARKRMEDLISRTSIVVLASHSRRLLEEWCNRAVLLNHGRIAAAGGVTEIADRYASLLAASQTMQRQADVAPTWPQARSAAAPRATSRPVMIGSPPDAGSTLLSVILDAHPEIACGPELGMFAHPAFWLDFSRFKDAVPDRKHEPSPSRDSHSALARGFAPYSGIYDRNLWYYGVESDALFTSLERFDDPAAFIDATFSPWMTRRGKQVFAEKSPVNLYGMHAFLDTCSTGRAICLVRNHLDQIVSLKARGFSFTRALSIWLVETAFCLHLAKNPRIHLMRYEDLVTDPALALQALCNFLDVAVIDDLPERYRDRSPRIIDDPTIALPSWRLSPSDGIRASAIGRGTNELTRVEIAAVHGAFIHAAPPELQFIAGQTLRDVGSRLGYVLPPCPELPIDELLAFLARENLMANDLMVHGSTRRKPSCFQERMVASLPAASGGSRRYGEGHLDASAPASARLLDIRQPTV